MEILKQFLLDLYEVGQQLQKKPPDLKESWVPVSAGGDPTISELSEK